MKHYTDFLLKVSLHFILDVYSYGKGNVLFICALNSHYFIKLSLYNLVIFLPEL